MAVYKKKITLSLANLRPVAERTMVGRIIGQFETGKIEHSQFGDYIRWSGIFRAQMVDKDGSIIEYFSRSLIVPDTASDYIANSFEHVAKGTYDYCPAVTSDGDGDDNRPLSVTIGLVVYLIPPSGARESRTGYEFEIEGFGGSDAADRALASLASAISLPSLPTPAPSLPTPAADEPTPAATPPTEPLPDATPPETVTTKHRGKQHAA